MGIKGKDDEIACLIESLEKSTSKEDTSKLHQKISHLQQEKKDLQTEYKTFVNKSKDEMSTLQEQCQHLQQNNFRFEDLIQEKQKELNKLKEENEKLKSQMSSPNDGNIMEKKIPLIGTIEDIKYHKSIKQHSNKISALHFFGNSDDNYLVSGSIDKSVIVWKVNLEDPINPISKISRIQIGEEVRSLVIFEINGKS